MTGFYCIKCKKVTDNKISGMGYTANRRAYRYGICSDCGSKKTRFIPYDTISGEGFSDLDDETSTFAKLAESAYTPEKDRMEFLKSKDVDGYDQDDDLSDAEHAVYTKDGKVIISYRGTVPSNVNDLKADARILLGELKNGPRYQRSLKAYEDAKKKYPDKEINLTGASLGARLANDIAIENKVKSHAFNIGSAPVDIKGSVFDYIKCTLKRNCKELKQRHKVYHTFGDIISVSKLGSVGETKIYKPKHKNVHSIANFY